VKAVRRLADRIPRPRRLRTTMLVLLGAAALYVLTLTGWLALRVGRAATQLSTGTTPVLEVYEHLTERAAQLNELVLLAHRVAADSAPSPGLVHRLYTRATGRGALIPSAAFAQLPEAMRLQLVAVDEAVSHLHAELVEIASHLELGQREAARAMLPRLDARNALVVRHLGAAQRIGLADLAERERRLDQAVEDATRSVGLWLLVGLALVPGTVWLVRRRFETPLAELEEGLARVAGGDLTATVPVRRPDELGQLAGHFNAMTGILRARTEEQGRFVAAGQLIADVAHEVNNPLMAIGALSDGRLDDPSLDAEEREDWVQVRRQARRAGKLVAGLLRFVRPTPPRIEAVPLNTVLRSALDLVSYRFPVDQIELDARLDPAHPWARGDAARCEQVLVNLLSNAIDAMRAVPPPRRLTVETGRRDDHVAVTVADTGPGIAPGLEGRIFLPFVTTKGTEGTGLGLYISRQIARDAGGDLTLEPADGHGARFVLRLPAAPAPAGEPPPVQAPADARSDAAPLGGLRILLVDDEAVVRRPVARYLARRGARVTEAADGYEALACLERAEVDVVLTDLRMPVMDGPELYRRLSTERPALARHVVFFSGDLRPLDGGEAPVPAERVLLKPVDLREVERKVLEVAGRRDA